MKKWYVLLLSFFVLLLMSGKGFAASLNLEPFVSINTLGDLDTAPGIGLKLEANELIQKVPDLTFVGGFEIIDSELEINRQNKNFNFQRDYDVDIVLLFLGAEYGRDVGKGRASVGAGPEFAFLSADNQGDFDNAVGAKIYGEYTHPITEWASLSGQVGFRFLTADFDPGSNIHWFAQDHVSVNMDGVFGAVSANIAF